MASTCDLYKGGRRLGSGTCSGGSTSITAYTANNNGGLAGDVSDVCARRNVQIVITQAGSQAGSEWNTRVLVDDGAGTLTLKDPCPYVGA